MGKIYASSDWHGCKVGNKVLDFLNKDDKLYFLGDAIDRGPHGFQLFNRLINDKRVEFLIGNHEAFMADAMNDIINWKQDSNYIINYSWGSTLEAWFNNSGLNTYNDLLIEPIDKLRYIENRLENMNDHLELSIGGRDVLLSHAGYTPGSIWRDDFTWNREHFREEWKGSENEYVVHGHTPTPHLKYQLGYVDRKNSKELIKDKKDWNDGKLKTAKMLRYCYGHKIDIDLCTIYTNMICLLDLETFEPIYFKGDE